MGINSRTTVRNLTHKCTEYCTADRKDGRKAEEGNDFISNVFLFAQFRCIAVRDFCKKSAAYKCNRPYFQRSSNTQRSLNTTIYRYTYNLTTIHEEIFLL